MRLWRAGSGSGPTRRRRPMKALYDELQLLTSKPRLVVLNTGYDDPAGRGAECARVIEKFGEKNVFVVSAKLEDELDALSDEERTEFVKELGVDERAKLRFIEKCHELLGLVRYYTSAHDKLQAWSIPAGTTAPQAAGKIHTDMERGFVKAEVMSYEHLVQYGSRAAVHTHGFLQNRRARLRRFRTATSFISISIREKAGPSRRFVRRRETKHAFPGT